MSQRIYLIVIAVLVFIILLQRSCTPSGNITGLKPGKAEVVYDTIWKTVTKTETKRVPLILRDTTFLPGDSVFVPDTNYDKLKIQYELLAKNYGTRNIYRDSVQLDTLGFIVVTDTIQYNNIKTRLYKHNYKLPTVVATVLPQPRRQLYIGGGISIDNGLGLSNLQTGLLYKNKKDQIYGLHTGISQNLQPYFGFSMYWKIKLKKD
jgi:hypothetical protein